MDQAASEAARQQTLARTVTVKGTGLHSGHDVEVALCPAPAGHGIRFRRTDLEGAPEIPLTPDSLESGVRCTALQCGNAKVRTVEHLLAACYALQVDNLLVELDAEELPILDGSAGPWLAALDEATTVPVDTPARYIRVSAPVLLTVGETHLMALPCPTLRLTVASVTNHPVAGSQMVDLDLSPAVFRERLATARTFCYLEEVETLLAAGLARGGSLDNAIVIRPDGYSSPLRMESELAAHKALDLVGDLAVLGLRLQGHIVAVRPGHHANQQLVRALWGQFLHNQVNNEQYASGGALPERNGVDSPRPITVG